MFSQEYSALKRKHTKFEWTKPVGYSFESVDKTFSEYEETIIQAERLIKEKEQEIRTLQQRIDELEVQLAQSNFNNQYIITSDMSEEEKLSYLNGKEFGQGAFIPSVLEEAITNDEAKEEDFDLGIVKMKGC